MRVGSKRSPANKGETPREAAVADTATQEAPAAKDHGS
jgi:hypothetical protein